MGLQLTRYRTPGPVGDAFFKSIGPIDLIMGPGGSGKTVACVFKGPTLAARYFPVCKDGWVKVKVACIRDTYRDFDRTALESWYNAFPKNHPWTVSHAGGQDRPVVHRLQWKAHRQGIGEIKIDYTMQTGAIGENNIEQYIKGYEISAGWLNECDMIDETVPGLLLQRTGRYPPVEEIRPDELERVSKDGQRAFEIMGLTAEPGEVILPRMVWGDFNPPDVDNWTYKFCVDEKRKGFNHFWQPGGLSPNAENRVGKPRSSYELEAATQEEHIVVRMVHSRFGYKREGKPVYSTFDHQRFVSDSDLDPIKGLPLAMGLDAGGSPAAVIGQFGAFGQLRLLAEICAEPGTGPSRFAEMVLECLMERFPNMPINEAWADPSAFYGGDNQSNELSDLAHMEVVARALNINILPAPSNEVKVRQEAVRWYLGKALDPGRERLVIDPRMKKIIGGFNAHYMLTKQASKGETDALAVKKNAYSHPHDALQYMCLGHRGRAGVIEDQSKMGRPANVVGMRQGRQQGGKPRDRMNDTKLW